MTGPWRVLVLAYGNPGRGDDALGPLLGERIEAWARAGVNVEIPMQLNIEHAAACAAHDAAIFVDASLDAVEPYAWGLVMPAPEGLGFTSHQLSPGAVLAVCHTVFEARPEAWLLGVRGYRFELGDPLSEAAAANLEAAFQFLTGWIAART